tara:strand:+ start:161 stop:676 length:516 start_codon:yes stop_codon:yes gene_type:complete
MKTNILIYFFLFVLILSSCPREAGEVFTQTIHHTDTIVRVDTFERRFLDIDTVFITEYDTIIDNTIYPIKQYEYDIKDSLLNATMKVQSPFKPRNVSLEYSLKSFKIKDSIHTVEPIKRQFLYGAEVHALPLLNGGYITLGYQDRKQSIYTVSVGNVNKTNILKVGFLKKF